MIPNPNNYDSLNFNVKIVAADDSSNVSGQCVYENGKYNGNGKDGRRPAYPNSPGAGHPAAWIRRKMRINVVW